MSRLKKKRKMKEAEDSERGVLELTRCGIYILI